MRGRLVWFAFIGVLILHGAGLLFPSAILFAASTDSALPPATSRARYFELKPGATVKITCSSEVRHFSVCDGENCTQLLSQPCAPYGCNAKGNECGMSCAGDRDCAEGSACDTLANKCAWMPTRCVDAFTIKNPNGTTQSCAPYECVANGCQQQCQLDGDCFTGYVCEDHVVCVPEPSQGSAGGGAPAPSAAGTSTTGAGKKVMLNEIPAQGTSALSMAPLGELPGNGERPEVSAGPTDIAGGQSVGSAAVIPAQGDVEHRGSGAVAAADCAVKASYLKPEPPVIEAASALQQGDAFRILCRFDQEEKDISPSRCDAEGMQAARRYREQQAWSARNRYSGMIDVDGITVRVAASPASRWNTTGARIRPAGS